MPTIPDSTKLLTTSELAQATAGGDDYIRTKGNKVVALALNPDYNPGVPNEIVFGDGPRVCKRARLFYNSGVAVPTYLKEGVNAWKFLGSYRASALREDVASIQESIRKYGKRQSGGPVVGVLYLENVLEPTVSISGGGFADPETRKEIEAAAVSFAVAELERRGYRVVDRQRENLGYDLWADSPSGELFVEVKGTDSDLPRFFLTRNELRCSEKHKQWMLFVVCNARSAPRLQEFERGEMLCRFELDPLSWECTQKI